MVMKLFARFLHTSVSDLLVYLVLVVSYIPSGGGGVNDDYQRGDMRVLLIRKINTREWKTGSSSMARRYAIISL